MEQLANCLPLHVIACVASSGAEPRLRYWLRAVRLLHSLSTVASRYPKLEQVCNVPLLIHEQQLSKSTLRYRLQKSDTSTLNCGQLLRYWYLILGLSCSHVLFTTHSALKILPSNCMICFFSFPRVLMVLETRSCTSYRCQYCFLVYIATCYQGL